MSNLLTVVVLDSSAKNNETDNEDLGDSKKVKRAQLIQAAFPNIVTYESKRGFEYRVKLFLVDQDAESIIPNSVRLLPDAKKSAIETTQRRNQSERCALITKAPA